MATEENGHWNLKEGIIIDEDTFGFIYEIVNTIENKIYIGKKQCKSKVKLKPLKGKTRARRKIKESDWKTYTSSSESLNNDINRLGKENFTFNIIRICSCKWELAYFEAKEQFDRNVLFEKNYYNGIINLRIGSPPKNLTL